MSNSGSQNDFSPSESDATSESEETQSQGTSFKSKAIRGSVISLIQTIIARSISFGCQIIFARMLIPSDYSLFAIAVGAMAIINLVSPDAVEDLLIQRGKRLANVLPSAWRFMTTSAILTSIAILVSAYFVSDRPGDRMKAAGDSVVTKATPLADIKSEPNLPELISEIRGDVVLEYEGSETRFELPREVSESTTLGAYMALLDTAIDTAVGSNKLNVSLDSETDRLVIETSEGAPVALQTTDPVSGSILEVLGIPSKSNAIVLLLILLAIQPLIMLLRTPFAAAARLSLRFEQIAIGYLIGDILGYSLAIVVLFLGGGPVALIMPMMVLPIVVLLNSMRLAWPLPKVPRDQRESILPVLRDAAQLCLGQWATNISRFVPPLVLAWFVTDSETGLYVWAALISVQVNVLLTENLRVVMVPIFSNLQEEPKRLISGFLQACRGLSGLTMPLFAGAAAVTPILIPVVFDPKWLPAVPIAAILLLAQSFACTNSVSVSLLRGTGRYRLWINLQFTRAIAFVATAILCSWLGGNMGLTWGMFVMFTTFSFVTLYLCIRGYGTITEVLKIYGAPLVASTPFIFVALGALELEANWLSCLVWCPLMLMGGLLLYIAVMRVIDRSRYDEFAVILGSVITRVRSART